MADSIEQALGYLDDLRTLIQAQNVRIKALEREVAALKGEAPKGVLAPLAPLSTRALNCIFYMLDKPLYEGSAVLDEDWVRLSTWPRAAMMKTPNVGKRVVDEINAQLIARGYPGVLVRPVNIRP